MDIAQISMALSQQNAMQSVGTAMLSKSLDFVETAGDQIASMIDASAMERSVNPSVGSNFDVSV